MSTYLSRTVFPWHIDWEHTPATSFTIDLGSIALTSGAPAYQPLTSNVVRGFDVQTVLKTEAAVQALETFLTSCSGRLNGFWYTGHMAEFKIVSSIDATTFWIEGNQYEAGNYIAFSKRDETTGYAMVTAVDEVGARQRVTIDAALTIDETWYARRLFYGRLATDDVVPEYVKPNFSKVGIRIVELPNEYAAIETGTRPVFLYELWFEGDPAHLWRYTSLNQNITSAAAVYYAWQITHTGRTASTAGGNDTLTVKTVYDNPDNASPTPIAKMFPFASSSVLWLRIYETTYAAPSARTQIWTGIVDDMTLDGVEATLTCKSIVSILGRNFPAFQICNRCNYVVFSALCGVSENDYKLQGQIQQVGGRDLVIKTTGYPDEKPHAYWNWGKIQWTNARTAEIEYRTIESALYDGATHLLIVTMTEKILDAQPYDTVLLWPGCDGQRQTCVAKFNNFSRWGGHNMVRDNISVTAKEVKMDTGNKK